MEQAQLRGQVCSQVQPGNKEYDTDSERCFLSLSQVWIRIALTSIPRGAAFYAFGFVDTQLRATFLALPTLHLIFDKSVDPMFRDHLQVVNHTHAIPLSVSLVQTFHFGAWVLVTFPAIWTSCILQLAAVFDFAFNAIA